MYDLVVVGAGPAGSSAAYHAARLGLSVVLLDKDRFPRPKICGGFVSAKALRCLPEALPAGIIQEEITRFRLVDASGRSVTAHASDVRQSSFGRPYAPSAPTGATARNTGRRLLGAMVLRSDFDHALLNMAERRGAELRCGVRVRSVRAADQGARQVRVASDDGVISARMCVLADGAASAISREARILGRFHKHFYGFALRRTPEGIRRPADGPSDTMELFSYPKPGGYAWVFPKAGSANIGVGSWAPKSRKLARDEESVLARLSRDSIYDIQWRQSAVGGAFVPIALTRRRLGRGPVVLAGDAAALVDPVTGEGIYHALESGLIAAQCAAGSLSAPASYSASYAGEVLRAFGLDLVSAFPWVLGRYVFDVFGLGTSRFLVERLARFASDSGAYRRFG